MRSRQHRPRKLFLSVSLLVCLVYTINLVRRDLEGNEKRSHVFYSHDSGTSLLDEQMSMLTPDQLARHYSIKSGKLSVRNIEIVLSRYNEDISWSDMYSSIRTIYDKSNSSHSSPLSTTGAGKVVALPNLGRESYTYLNHIVSNYDTLAAVTVFSQASEPRHGYSGHRKGGGHLMSNSSFHDFILSKTGHFVFTGAVWLPTLAHLLRSGYNKETANRQQAMQQCPTPILTEPGGSEYRFDLEDKNHLHLLKHIASRCTAEASTTCTGYSFWQKFVKLPLPKESTVFFSQGATFSVTAEQIRKRPLEDYKSLLQEVAQSDDPSAGFFLEWMWYYILTSDIDPCPTGITGHEFYWAKVQPYFKTLELQKRVKFTAERIAELSKKFSSGKKIKKSWPFF